MDTRIMENTQNKKKRIGEIVITFLILVCVALILIDMTTNLVKEFDTQENKAVISETLMPTPNARPTYPPDYTPAYIIID